jgi:putative acyl-CoA dehydrogenase
MNTEFFQPEVVLKNQFLDDAVLQRLLKQYLPGDFQKEIFSHLQEVGEDARGKLFQWAHLAESNPPKLKNYSTWGKRIDEIEVSDAWRHLEEYAAIHGIVASGYERKQKEFSRVYQSALLYLYHPSSAIFSCPLAMTDGAARAIEVHGDDKLKQTAFKNLISRNPKNFWTSGQWMTEKIGGSDVGQTQTIARKAGTGFELTGMKWFTSAATSQMAMTLARPEGAESGSKGLSLFYLETRKETGEYNNFKILRLKDKLGTKALPTAELQLEGTRATLVGGEGNGVRKIATLFNITRYYNSVCAVGYMRRALALAEDFSRKRIAFGKPIIEQPLHRRTLDELHNEFENCMNMVFHLAFLLGKDETGMATTQESALLRLLMTLTKLYTGKSTSKICNEVMEIFGGVGYCEDSGIPVILRNAQVLSIWEGTTNVLSLDVLRALSKECPFEIFEADILKRIEKNGHPQISEIKTKIQNIKSKFSKLISHPDQLQAEARHLSFAMAQVYMDSLAQK